ncbi:DUF6567 family protein [Reichenbachiella versicolor]|uniref:DUF6567 family protein n=1 Tax=Reichenbachiella versicolor TaxID=1821036 RepID=UPI000D6DC7D5|nr:DUF6567 family protein [Reichenbachiella versicolor]
MKSLIHLTIVVCVSINLLSSCSYHLGSVSGGSAVITNDKFKSIDYAFGTSRTTNFLGIGGNSKDALVLEAKRNLFLNSDIQLGQVLGQTTTDFKRTIFFPLFTTKVLVSAEIIDFTSKEIDSISWADNIADFTNKPSTDYFNFGQKVPLVQRKDTIIGQIVDVKPEVCLVKFYDHRNNLRIKKIPTVTLVSYQKKIPVLSLDQGNPIDYFTPKDPKNELVKFQHKGIVLEGELMEQKGDVYLIRMQKESGNHIGFYVKEEDLVSSKE